MNTTLLDGGINYGIIARAMFRLNKLTYATQWALIKYLPNSSEGKEEGLGSSDCSGR